jgi:hypothetical protein
MAWMKRQLLRLGIAGLVVVVTGIAGLMLMAGYEKETDARARFQTEAVQIEPDRGYVWLKIHLKRSGEEQHDLMKPVRLIAHDGQPREPDNMELAGNPEQGFTDLWFSFWMEKHELEGKINLQINDGILKIKESDPIPKLEGTNVRVFKSSNWEKSWLGF